MGPVGRKSKVPPLPEGGSFQCLVAGCSYQTESSRELALHSRECGQPWYVCQTRGCGHRGWASPGSRSTWRSCTGVSRLKTGTTRRFLVGKGPDHCPVWKLSQLLDLPTLPTQESQVQRKPRSSVMSPPTLI